MTFLSHLTECDYCYAVQLALLLDCGHDGLCPVGSELLYEDAEEVIAQDSRWEGVLRLEIRRRELAKEAAMNEAFYSGGEL